MNLRREGDFSLYEQSITRRIHGIRRRGDSPSAQLLRRYDQIIEGDGNTSKHDVEALIAGEIIEPFQDMGIEYIVELKNIARKARQVSKLVTAAIRTRSNHRLP